MGFLDELKRDAEAAKVQETAARIRRDAFELTVKPKMRELRARLTQVADQLNLVKTDVVASYEVQGFGTLSGLRQREYKLECEDADSLDSFTFKFQCFREGAEHFQKENRAAAKHQKEYMWSHGLRFESKALADGRGVFVLDRIVPVFFHFASDFEKAAIRLRIRNLETLGTSSYTYDPSAITEQLMEELVKSFVRKPNRFNELSGNSIPEDTLARLRKTIAESKQNRERELHGEAPAGDETKKKGLFKRPLGKGLFGK